MSPNLIRLFTAFVIAISLYAAPAPAQDIDTFVMVPDHPQGVRVDGCFRATRNLYGPYRLTFCLERRGTYMIRGGGARCDGRLTFHTRGRDIFVDLQRASCGNRRAWEAARMECRSNGNPLSRLAGRILNVPHLAGLRCTYFPTVRGARNETFTATRQ
ncbi:hypothetical protein [Devosia sp. CN2-171]|jgi:hypothetical protein|uniref:hypothetical protein n=1 Tax=Devosia sp. CN2-171 TaxID=3400909 RepID=UPI003BF77239